MYNAGWKGEAKAKLTCFSHCLQLFFSQSLSFGGCLIGKKGRLPTSGRCSYPWLRKCVRCRGNLFVTTLLFSCAAEKQWPGECNGSPHWPFNWRIAIIIIDWHYLYMMRVIKRSKCRFHSVRSIKRNWVTVLVWNKVWCACCFWEWW